MKVLIDVKNLALYNGGIAHWIRHLLIKWVDLQKSSNEFIFVYPAGLDLNKVTLEGGDSLILSWPAWLPRQLRHPLYDNWQFPLALRRVKPQFFLSPYHDVRLPRKSNAMYSVITVHDLAFLDVPQSYPFFIKRYYLMMLRLNLKRAHHVITVSQSTKMRLVEQFGLRGSAISVIPNAIEQEFLEAVPSKESIALWRDQHMTAGTHLVLYSGGIEYRKNIERLLNAFRLIWRQGKHISLCITGTLDARWRRLFSEEEISSGKVQFLGFLSLSELRLAYSAADCIVYPSLCEGFGRVCIESMVCGTPLACSNLPVFQEIAGDYPNYFDPLDIEGMANAIELALAKGHQTPFQDKRFGTDAVQAQFISVMNGLMENAQNMLMKSE